MLRPLAKLERWQREQLFVQLAGLPWHGWLMLAGFFLLLVVPVMRRPVLSWLIFPEQGDAGE